MLNQGAKWVSLIFLVTVQVYMVITFIKYGISNASISHHDNFGFPNEQVSNCLWGEGDPVLLQLKSLTHVNYDAGHWFHMAENIMIHHSLLRNKSELITSPIVYYSFDRSGFIEKLNALTRMIVYLGTISQEAQVQELRFISSPEKIWQYNLNPGDKISFPSNRLDHLQSETIQLSKNSSLNERFVRKNIEKKLSLRKGVQDNQVDASTCIKYIGTIGGAPLPRGKWFTRDQDVATFKKKIHNVCDKVDIEKENKYSKKRKKYKLVLYQRDQSRKLEDIDKVVISLENRLGKDLWEIHILVHANDYPPCVMWLILRDTDVLITPHGFQSMLLIFMPPSSLIFEVFPYRYHKVGYASFGREYGLIYDYSVSKPTRWDTAFFLSFIETPNCMLSKFCRGYARNQNVILDVDGENHLVEVIQNKLIPSLITLPS